MTSFCRMGFLTILTFIGLFGQAAWAAPAAVPKTFSGIYTASGFCSSSVDDVSINRSYQGQVKIDSTGKVSGRISRTTNKYLGGGIMKESKSRVDVSGKITKVRASVHAGYKVLIATTRITLSDGTTGTLKVYFPYTVPTAGMSGSGTIAVGGMSGSMMFQKQP